MAERERERRPRRPTGIPRRTLDRSRRYVIAYVGTRWEVVGEPLGLVAPWTRPDVGSGAGAGGASTETAPDSTRRTGAGDSEGLHRG